MPSPPLFSAVGGDGRAQTVALGLERKPKAVSAVFPILLGVLEAPLRKTTQGPAHRRGLVNFGHRFGSARNRHLHDPYGIF